MTKDRIAEKLRRNGIPAAPELAERLLIYLKLLQEWNEKMDLTAVEGEEELLDKHFMDSLLVPDPALLPENSALIDVGTGAGFPGMVLALARPDLRITLLDARQKRMSFLETVARETGRPDIRLLHGRAEDCARQAELREQFDLAVARAVAPLNVLCELLLPYVRVGGRALCWKGPALEEEMEAGRRAAFLLGGRTEAPLRCAVADRAWEHVILPIRKERKTPGLYPRKAGRPKADPLG